MSDAFYALDRDWRVVYANRRALAFWRVPADAVVGRLVWDALPQLVGTPNETMLRSAADGRQTVVFEAPSPVTGTWVQVTVAPHQSGLGVYWRDITERKQAEAALEQRVQERTRILQQTLAALQESRTRYGAIFEHAPVDLVFLRVLPDGRLLCEDVNPAWALHSGYSREQVVGRTLDQIFPPEQAAFFETRFRHAIETGLPAEYEYTTQFPVGEAVGRAFLVPLYGANGKVEFVLLTALDLTQMRRIEAQLRQAQKMEAIGQLTGGIAHDFNNLLTAVTGNLELLQRRIGDAGTLRYVETALRAAQRGGALTQQLLAYARQQHLSPRPIDVNAVLQGMQELLQRSLGDLAQVAMELDPALWPGRADPVQLESMVLNLAINARDAMPQGGTLRIATRNLAEARAGMAPELEPGDYVVIAVIDSGTGMSRAVQERAFEPFFTTKDVGKGSGLGLAQVFGLSRQFGGAARLHSVPDRGTTVEIFLPRARFPDVAATEEASPARQRRGADDG